MFTRNPTRNARNYNAKLFTLFFSEKNKIIIAEFFSFIFRYMKHHDDDVSNKYHKECKGLQ